MVGIMVSEEFAKDIAALKSHLEGKPETVERKGGAMTQLTRAAALAVLGLLSAVPSAWPAADAVTHWNAITVNAATAGRPGSIGFLDVALVQAAVSDAVQSIEGKFKPYKVEIEGASGSPAAAAAAAAHGVLVALYPTQANPPQTPPLVALNDALATYLNDNGLLGDPGIAVGQQVAAAMLAFYRANPSPLPPPYRGCDLACQPGEWRPTPNYIGAPPPPAAAMTTPWLATMDPFTLRRPDQFRAAPPPPLRSGRYLRDYNEVKALGAFESTAATPLTRTTAQTALAYFWSENFMAQWNRALRAIAEAHVPGIADRARLFALANMATADAVITAWDSKVHFSFWRPVTAIQEGDADGNHRTEGDPDWKPLINNPPYPDFTSGANNVTGAMTKSLRLFFGTDHFDFTVTSNSPALTDPASRTRTFTRFSQAAQEVVEARILLGIHFRFADEVAREQGERVAHWAFRRFLRPVRHHEDCDHDHDH